MGIPDSAFTGISAIVVTNDFCYCSTERLSLEELGELGLFCNPALSAWQSPWGCMV